MKLVLATILSSLAATNAKDNGLALTPPMGWRSWNLYGKYVNQKLIQDIMTGMTDKSRGLSLAELGYSDVGLDDNWQLCENGTYHDPTTGRPIVNLELFPNLKEMTDFAHDLGLTAGFYGNNCICAETTTSDELYYQGDVDVFKELGFDGWKLDGCGAQTDLVLWDKLISAADLSIVVENCHWGTKEPFEPKRNDDGTLFCPWNFYRTSADVQTFWWSVLLNLETVTKYAESGLSVPGCWAYPDMLEVGVPGLTFEEWRSHFGMWAIVSSPLVLSHDVNNSTLMDEIYPIIGNVDILSVNQKYTGHSGGPFEAGVKGDNSTIYYYKDLGEGGIAIMLINNSDDTAQVKLKFSEIPGLGDYEGDRAKRASFEEGEHTRDESREMATDGWLHPLLN